MASLIGATAIAVLVAVTVGTAAIGAAMIGRHRAQSAADLAALAGAGRVAEGAAAACAHAAAVAAAVRTVVTGCEVDGLDVIVTVQADTAVGIWGLGPAGAASRAGPTQASR